MIKVSKSGLLGVCCNTLRWSCQAVLAVQTGVCGWALWCNNKQSQFGRVIVSSSATTFFCIFFELLASACHMPHMIEHCLLLCPVFIMLVYGSLWIKNHPSCCWLHFELYFSGRWWYFQSILWYLPLDLSSGSTSCPQWWYFWSCRIRSDTS